MATVWDPAQYGRFGDERLRPALDLLQRVVPDSPRLVHDIGCGQGHVTRVLAERWPAAEIVGSDSSPEMLDAARAAGGRIRWEAIDLATWQPDPIHDVLYANAVLHWLPDHPGLLRRLLDGLAAGGILAVQMPLSWYEPSHAALRDALQEGGYGTEALRAQFADRNVEPAEFYVRLLRPLAAKVDVWTSRYFQVLDGPGPVLEWMKGSILRPILTQLVPEEAERFLTDLGARLAAAYPEASDGTTLYPFPRLFIVAGR